MHYQLTITTMNPDQKALQKAIEIIGRLKGQMLKSTGFSDMEILTYLNADHELKELKSEMEKLKYDAGRVLDILSNSPPSPTVRSKI